MVRIGIIGSGRMGRVHANNAAKLKGEALVVGCSDADPAVAEHLAAQLDARAYGSATELLTDSGIDAVVIASPTPTHAEIALQALEHLRRGHSPGPATMDELSQCFRIVVHAQGIEDRFPFTHTNQADGRVGLPLGKRYLCRARYHRAMPDGGGDQRLILEVPGMRVDTVQVADVREPTTKAGVETIRQR